ncbi:MAG TPA: LptF/LptG family permease [Allosphingosinicella sp.]|nr:LptF/LptG family permease [Allosphingosinicella sp.]
MRDPALSASAVRALRRRRRPGRLDWYLIRGLAPPFLIVSLGACAAMMLERALRLIQELAAAGADIAFFLPLLAQLAPYYLNLALPVGLFAALVLLVARLDERLELEAMLASGLSFARIAAPLTAASLVVTAASLVTGGWLEPYGRHGFRATKAAAINAGRVGGLQSRAFYRPAEGLALTFDRRAEDGSVEGVFVWQRISPRREMVLTAQSGSMGIDAERLDMVLALERGRYVADPLRPDPAGPYVLAFRTMRFEESLLVNEASWQRGWDQKEMDLVELAEAAAAEAPRVGRAALEAELYERLARSLTIPLLPFLVLPLAFAVKKGRRGLGILLAGAVLALFHHGLNFAKNLGVAGAADSRVAIMAVTASFTLVVAALFVSGRHLPSHSPAAAALNKAMMLIPARPRGGIALKGPGGTIASYLALNLARHIVFAAVAIVAILQMVDIFDRGDDFVQRGMGVADMAYYALLRLPPVAQQAIPIAALAGGMFSFVTLSRSREMVAVRAAGISQFRIFRMAAPVYLVLALIVFLLAERVTPASQLRFEAWWSATAVGERRREAEPRWFRIGSDIVRAARTSPDGSRLEDVVIFRRGPDSLISERVAAASATSAARGWMLSDVRRIRFGDFGAAFDRPAALAWPTPLRPDDVQQFFTPGLQLPSAAARRAIEVTAPVDRGEPYFETRVLRIAAEPVAPLVMLLLALPLAFVHGRTGRTWPGLLYASAGGLVYLVADGVLTVTAQAGIVPAAIGAWTAPVLGVLTGWWVLLWTER